MIQAATIIVRGIALGELSIDGTWRRLRREMRVSLINGSVCGILLFVVVSVIDNPYFGSVLALALLAVILECLFDRCERIPLGLKKK